MLYQCKRFWFSNSWLVVYTFFLKNKILYINFTRVCCKIGILNDRSEVSVASKTHIPSSLHIANRVVFPIKMEFLLKRMTFLKHW